MEYDNRSPGAYTPNDKGGPRQPKSLVAKIGTVALAGLAATTVAAMIIASKSRQSEAEAVFAACAERSVASEPHTINRRSVAYTDRSGNAVVLMPDSRAVKIGDASYSAFDTEFAPAHIRAATSRMENINSCIATEKALEEEKPNAGTRPLRDLISFKPHRIVRQLTGG